MKKKTIYWIIGIFLVFILISVFTPDNSEDKLTTQTTSEEGNLKETSQEEETVTDETIETISSEESKEMYLVTRIIDGDTIEISTGERVRLICIDTPETNEYYYSEASSYLTNLVLNKDVELIKDISETDRYGRLLRYIYLDGAFVNELIVYNGYGKVYPYSPDTSKCPIIQEAEQHAKSNNLGIWEKAIEEEQEESSSGSEIICSYNTYNCGDFSTCSEVMKVFNACSYDIHDLDRDNDNIPCETLCG